MNPVGAFLILAIGASFATTAVADEPVCDPGNPTDPGSSQVEALANDTDCAQKDDFKNSCAYKNFVRKEQKANLDKVGVGWAANFARIFDSSATFGTGEDALAKLRDAVKKPGFFDFLDWWATHDRIAYTNNLPESIPSSVSKDEARGYLRALSYLKIMDDTNMVRSALEMLAMFPDEERAKVTKDQFQELLRSLFRRGYEYKLDHNVGCGSFYAKMSQSSKAFEKFGPQLRPGDFTPSAERKDAEKSAIEKTSDFRGIANVTKNLAACGGLNTAVRHSTGILNPSCDVNLPMVIFPDNEATLTAKSKKILADAIASDECFKKMTAKGMKIAKIAVATSANTVHNTKNYCKRDFAKLSGDRATTVLSAMKDQFPAPGIEFEPHSGGGNGDGTSGDCAYEAILLKKPEPGSFEVKETVDGKEVTRSFREPYAPEYSTDAKRKSLEKNKYAITTIYFEDKSQVVDGKDYQWSTTTACRTVEFDCR
ncbi:MAG: hypothetical protein JST04_17205 [Bdellovibrionales bacterium]|nr:hypothetical protein [Bdellovibrionales bacterium]